LPSIEGRHPPHAFFAPVTLTLTP